MEKISTTNPECTSHYEFNDGAVCRCAHVPAQKTTPLAPIHPFTKQMVATFIVSRIIDTKLVEIVFPVLCVCLIKGFIPPKTFIHTHRFFLFVSFIFIAHFFVDMRELV